MIESNSFYYLINAREYIRYTTIKADYLCEHKESLRVLYLFLAIERLYPKFKNECKGCSFFAKHNCDYTVGTSKTTTLMIEKIENENTTIIFKSPSYQER